MKSVAAKIASTVTAAGLVGGGIVAGVAIGQQAGAAPAPVQQRPAAQTVDVVPQPVEQGATLQAKPQAQQQSKPDTTTNAATTTAGTSTVDSTTTTSGSTSTQPSATTTTEAPVTTSPTPTPDPTPAAPSTPAAPPTLYTELPTPTPGGGNQGG